MVEDEALDVLRLALQQGFPHDGDLGLAVDGAVDALGVFRLGGGLGGLGGLGGGGGLGGFGRLGHLRLLGDLGLLGGLGRGGDGLGRDLHRRFGVGDRGGAVGKDHDAGLVAGDGAVVAIEHAVGGPAVHGGGDVAELDMLIGGAGDREAGEVGRGRLGVHYGAALGEVPVAAVGVVRPGDEPAGAALLDGLAVGMLGDLHGPLLHQHLHGGGEPFLLAALGKELQTQLHALLAGLGELGGGDLHVLLAQLGHRVLLAFLLPVLVAGDGQARGLERLAHLIDGLLGLGSHEDVRVIGGG